MLRKTNTNLRFVFLFLLQSFNKTFWWEQNSEEFLSVCLFSLSLKSLKHTIFPLKTETLRQFNVTGLLLWRVPGGMLAASLFNSQIVASSLYSSKNSFRVRISHVCHPGTGFQSGMAQWATSLGSHSLQRLQRNRHSPWHLFGLEEGLRASSTGQLPSNAPFPWSQDPARRALGSSKYSWGQHSYQSKWKQTSGVCISAYLIC